MKPWRWLLALLVVAALAAFGWHWVAADPGYVLIRIRGWRIESSLVVVVVGLLLAWAIIGFVWRAIRWPFGAVARRNLKLSRARLTNGLIALYEGRHADAQRALARAAHHGPQRALALLASADAARRRGDSERALAILDDASEGAPVAARVLRARTLRGAGRAGDAVKLLAPAADAGKLPPAGWREYAEAALAAGEPERARAALDPLRKRGVLDAAVYADLERRAVGAQLAAAPDADALNQSWRGLSRAQRNEPALIGVYATRAAATGAGLAAMDEIESALRRHWDPELVDIYANLAGDHADQRLRHAEGWLAGHEDDPHLLTTLGRMCAREGLWGKARGYLDRALKADPDGHEAWRALGDVEAGQGDPAAAIECYRKAFDHAAEPHPTRARLGVDAAPAVVEERDQHGLPRLPARDLEADDEGA